ncbi:hypothetical protein HBB16_06600 [Pseudonocardia sp. MCCB 268]|nr:hypothetical protein [Pseudonocardia cytotoxica]
MKPATRPARSWCTKEGPADATFGFASAWLRGTQRKLEAADLDSLRDLVAAVGTGTT